MPTMDTWGLTSADRITMAAAISTDQGVTCTATQIESACTECNALIVSAVKMTDATWTLLKLLAQQVKLHPGG